MSELKPGRDRDRCYVTCALDRRISMREAGRRNGISDSSIAHYEQGRMDVSPDRVRQVVESYGYAMQDFNEYAGGKPLPTLSIKDECV